MIVAVEDALSESVVRKLIAVTRPDINVSVVLGRQGRGYLQKKARDLDETARSVPVFILADLDQSLSKSATRDRSSSRLQIPVTRTTSSKLVTPSASLRSAD